MGTMTSMDRVRLYVATAACVGYAPVAPGTFGTVVAIPLAALLGFVPAWAAAILILAVVACAVWAADGAEKVLGKKDPGAIVIDEVAGYLVTLALVPPTVTALFAGFVLFRIADIAKPFPIRRLETRYPGGFGVVADDLLAGVYAHVALRIFLHFWGA